MFTYDYMIVFKIVCLVTGTTFYRRVSMLDYFLLSINDICLTAISSLVARLIIFQVIFNFSFFISGFI